MRIVVIGRFGVEAFGLHIAETFRAMGHDVVQCDPFSDVSLGWFDPPFLPAISQKVRFFAVKEMLSRERYARNLVREIRAKLSGSDCDLILATHDFLSPVSLEALRREFAAPLVLWFPDAVSRFEKSFMLTGLYDLMFFKDPYVVERCRRELGLLQTHYLPECCRADLHTLDASVSVAAERDLGTAGNIHPARAVVLQKLIRSGFRVTVWGPPAARWMSSVSDGIESCPFVAGHDKVRAFRSCRIVLNTTHPAEIEGTNVRTFEVAAAGAFQLVNHRSALKSLFHVGEELITFSSLDDLVDKVRYYLPRDEERRQIAEKAKQRALAEHTYEHRLAFILSMMEETHGSR